MKRFIIIVILSLTAVSLSLSGSSGADFFESNEIGGSTFAASCWVPPSASTLLTPENEVATNAANVTFSWNSTTSTCPIASMEYSLQVSSENDFVSPLLTSPYGPSTSYLFTSIPEGTYFWRVAADDGFGNISTSSSFTLTIDRTPPSISNINHLVATPNDTNDATATISWDTDELTTSNLEYSTTLGGPYTSLPNDMSADNITHSRTISSLTADTTYYFRVRSTDAAGNESVSTENMFKTDNTRLGLPALTNIVINEYLPNPSGNDDASMPAGEWVEIYNRGTTTRDLSGWYLSDANSSHRLYITTVNTITSNPSTSGLSIAPGEYFVVYRNGDVSFDLDNAFLGDEVVLYRPGGWVMDFHVYTGLLGDTVLENKSFARFPDGSNTWFDPIPTPLGPNELEATATITLADDKKSVSFKLEHISGYKTMDYKLAYDTYSVTKGVSGDNVDVIGLTTYEKNNIDLATCSGEVCTYDQAVNNFVLQVTLKKADGTEVTLSATK